MDMIPIYKILSTITGVHLGLADKLLIKNFNGKIESWDVFYNSREILIRFSYKSKELAESIKKSKDYEIGTLNYWEAKKV